MYEFLHYRVSDAMTRDPVTISQDTTLGELEAIFARNDFNGVPVVDHTGRLEGVATKLDILRAFSFTTAAKIPHYEEIVTRPVAEVMTREPITVPPELPLTRVLDKMVETRNKSFPVATDGVVTGVIAREDLLWALRRATTGQGPEAAGDER
ncbi:CBS domain-containing protein [Arhodomonas sp. AD133]|uniref:CBS domain-containing protein n=1 Tax=Arhodomonas sp. AD133 TaxID=3415009 RepID=UPI003EBB4BD8